MSKLHGLAVAAALVSVSASAHHGFGRFDPSRDIELEGTLTGVDFVNPHAYMYFEAVAEDGTVVPMRCEMRAATVLRRSGWSEEMFVNGAHVTIAGRPHRMPTTARAVGRSPSTTPATTGTAAVRNAEMGATTLIGPFAIAQ